MQNRLLAHSFPAIIFAFLLLAGCSTGPEVQSISKAPGVTKPPQSLLVLAVSASETRRSVMEDALVSRLRAAGYEAQPYGPAPQLPWEDPTQLRDTVEQQLKSRPAAGVLTVSLVRKNRQIEYIPNQVIFNPVTTSMGALASVTYMETINVPSQYTESTQYILRTTLFEVESGEAIWRMFSSTVDPTSLNRAAEEFARVVVRELQKSFESGPRE